MAIIDKWPYQTNKQTNKNSHNSANFRVIELKVGVIVAENHSKFIVWAKTDLFVKLFQYLFKSIESVCKNISITDLLGHK